LLDQLEKEQTSPRAFQQIKESKRLFSAKPQGAQDQIEDFGCEQGARFPAGLGKRAGAFLSFQAFYQVRRALRVFSQQQDGRVWRSREGRRSWRHGLGASSIRRQIWQPPNLERCCYPDARSLAIPSLAYFGRVGAGRLWKTLLGICLLPDRRLPEILETVSV